VVLFMAAGLCGTAMVVGCVVAAAFNLSSTKNTDSSSIDEQAIKVELASAPMTAVAETSLQEFSQPETPPLAEIPAVSTVREMSRHETSPKHASTTSSLGKLTVKVFRLSTLRRTLVRFRLFSVLTGFWPTRTRVDRLSSLADLMQRESSGQNSTSILARPL
jgi:hypothetical protein